MSIKKGLQSPFMNDKLTPAEKEVKDMITKEFLTPKQIQIRRNCTRQAVHRIIKNLKAKGAINLALQDVDKNQWSCQPNCQHVNKVRLHAQEWNIRILWQDSNYQKLLQKSNIFHLKEHTIRLYKNSIEIYSGKGTCFFADNEQRAMSKSLEYWKRFFTRLEHELKIILIKPRSRNIKLVNQHFARGNSEIYKNAIKHGEPIRIYAKEDGKLAFVTDDSFGFKEDETVHPITSKQDRGMIDKQLNDWRKNDPPTLSEVMRLMEKQAELNKESSSGLLTLIRFMEAQIPKSQKLNQKSIGELDYIG
tara:strand:- start:180 stop:1094 length:915 start_codon:yes stop_codon:yes gene_type:complete